MSIRETTSWRWEYAVRRQDGAIVTSVQWEYPWNQKQAEEYASSLNHAAKTIGSTALATVVQRRRTTTVRTLMGRWGPS